MTSLHVIFDLVFPPIKNPGYAYARGGGAFWAVPPPPQIAACAFQARVNFCILAQEDQQTFARKQVTTDAFFL